MEKCKDCGLELRNKHEKSDHDGLCCDCADELLGMPANCRSRSRPVPKPETPKQKENRELLEKAREIRKKRKLGKKENE